MTENEKLRALLAEARNALSQGCWNGRCCAVRERIDAALAEPVVASRMEKPSNTTWARFAYDFRERAEAAERERDEARASHEYDRAEWDKTAERMETLMKGLVASRDEARAEVAYWKGEFSRLHEEHLPVAFAGAYRRGAEAMREAAANHIRANRIGDDSMALALVASIYEKDIRALPIPEDKP